MTGSNYNINEWFSSDEMNKGVSKKVRDWKGRNAGALKRQND